MKLVIVESPAKAKTIEKFLGKDFKVIASKGHIRDLNPYRLSINIIEKNNRYFFEPKYMINKDHKEIANEIKELARNAEKVYIASDDDREGEAIGWHITQLLKAKKISDFPRIVFHEITKTAILNAVKNPRIVDMNKVNAQQARRLLDRIVGYTLSPLLSKKILKGLSAGRVQSSTLGLVVKRERSIQAFKPKTYFILSGKFKHTDIASLVKYNNKVITKLSIRTEQEAKDIKNNLLDKDFKVVKISKKESVNNPLAPFTTSSLQQAASNHLGFSPSRTMKIAQKLYEGVNTPKGRMGIITYMRTDSLNIAKEAQDTALKYIEQTYGKEYAEPHIYTKKSKGAQEAHEAIRPSHIEFTPEMLKSYLQPEEYKLYNLIFKRFIATQMSSSKFIITTIDLENADTKSIFRIKGKILKFNGWRKVYDYLTDKDKVINNYKENEILKLDSIDIAKKQEEPPARYSEATLIKEMEKLGIGRPSTYASTVTLLKHREYVTITNKKLVPTEKAFKVIGILEKHFPNILSTSFTAEMEDKLDLIAEGKENWQDVLNNFYKSYKESLDKGYLNIKSEKVVEDTGRKCPKCGGRLVKRKGRYGDFVGCENYPKCKYIETIKKEPEYLDGYKCPKCGGRIVIKHYKNKIFYGCENYPKCKYTASSIKKLEKDLNKGTTNV